MQKMNTHINTFFKMSVDKNSNIQFLMTNYHFLYLPVERNSVFTPKTARLSLINVTVGPVFSLAS